MIKIKNRTKKLAIILLAVMLFLLIIPLGIRLYFRLPVMNYCMASEKAFKIPEIDKGFVPQGFCYDEEKGVFLISGYSSKDKPSAIHVVNKASGETVKSVELLKEDGTPHTGHSGGVAQFKDWVYVAGSTKKCLYVYSYSQILGEEKQVKAIGEFSLKISDEDYIRTSFVSAMNGKLVVGEYFDNDNTLESHKVTSKGGETFGGLAVEFILQEKYEYGIVPNPIRAYALPNNVQGVHFEGEKLYTSISRGLKHAHVNEYKFSMLEKAESIDVLGRSLELFLFTESSRLNSYKIMPMSEEITMVDGKLYVMSEFACNKYVFGKFTSSKWCYATNLSAM